MTMTDLSPGEQLRSDAKAIAAELQSMLDERVAKRAEFKPDDLPEAEREAARAAFAAEEAAFDAAFRAKDEQGAQIRAQLAQHRTAAERVADAERELASHGTGVGRINEPEIYREDGPYGFYRDVALVCDPRTRGVIRNAGSLGEAAERLFRHEEFSRNRAERRANERLARAERQIDEGMREEGYRGDATPIWERDQRYSPSVPEMRGNPELRINPSTVQGQGGYFTPPEWQVENFIPYLRAGRVTADLCRHMDLPPGVASVNIPKVSTPTLVAAQGANNVAVVSQDAQDTVVATGFRTFAGQEDVAVQWLDFSPSEITDRVLTEDLTAAYNLCLGQNVITGTGTANSVSTSGGLAGLYPTTNWSATKVTCTQASPTAANLYATFGAQASQIAQARFDLSNVNYVWHPRRGLWFATALDGASSRPFVQPSNFPGFNPGAIEMQNVAQGKLLSMPWGPGVYIDKNVPTTDNGDAAGGTWDISIAAKWDDVWLFEDSPRIRVLQEVLSGTLQVRYQIFSYAGMLVRYGSSVAIAEGSGFAAPTANGGSF